MTSRSNGPSFPSQPRLSLWDALTVLSGAVAIGNAWVAAKILGGSFGITAAALLLGCLIGAGCIWLVRAFGRMLMGANSSSGAGNMISPRMAAIAYVVAALWLIASGLLGYQITSKVLRLLISH